MARLDPKTKIKVLADTNPHKVGSKDFSKFKKLKAGMTVTEALATGLDNGYLLYSHRRKVIELEGFEDTAAPVKSSGGVATGYARSNVRSSIHDRSNFKGTHYLFDDPDNTVIVTEEGGSQSGIKTRNGDLHTVRNEWLTPVGVPPAEPQPINTEGTHLHTLWTQGAKALKGLKTGFGLCGVDVPHKQLTVFPADTECPRCLQLARRNEAYEEPPPMASRRNRAYVAKAEVQNRRTIAEVKKKGKS